MIESSALIFVLSLMNVAIHILLNKWGAITWYQLNRPKWLPADCNFCFFFWLAILEFAAGALIGVIIGASFDWFSYISSSIIYALCGSVLSLFFKPKA
jgi:tryptophan-rich sensory protein